MDRWRRGSCRARRRGHLDLGVEATAVPPACSDLTQDGGSTAQRTHEVSAELDRVQLGRADCRSKDRVSAGCCSAGGVGSGHRGFLGGALIGCVEHRPGAGRHGPIEQRIVGADHPVVQTAPEIVGDVGQRGDRRSGSFPRPGRARGRRAPRSGGVDVGPARLEQRRPWSARRRRWRGLGPGARRRSGARTCSGRCAPPAAARTRRGR